jgi:uncharacterized protein DUF4336
VLEPLADNIWTYQADYRVGLLHIPHRVTVMRTPDGGAIVHSPARPDEALCAEIDALGPIEAVIWPSWWHDIYLKDWCAHLDAALGSSRPWAKICVAPELAGAARSSSNVHVLGDVPLAPELDQLYVDGLGVHLNEFVFFHRPSKALVVADLIVNVPPGLGLLERTFFGLMGAYPGPKVPWFYRAVARDRDRLRAKFDAMLAWDFDRLIMGHGDVITTDARAKLRRAVDALFASARRADHQ